MERGKKKNNHFSPAFLFPVSLLGEFVMKHLLLRQLPEVTTTTDQDIVDHALPEDLQLNSCWAEKKNYVMLLHWFTAINSKTDEVANHPSSFTSQHINSTLLSVNKKFRVKSLFSSILKI